jgi:hypothetical protein
MLPMPDNGVSYLKNEIEKNGSWDSRVERKKYNKYKVRSA